MRGFRSFAVLACALTLPVLTGCATHAAKGNPPRCTAVGCTEALDLAAAGPGSTVQLVRCEGNVQTTRRYVLESRQWTLRMYDTRVSDPCPAVKPVP
jgi:hypothetical protein